MYIFSMEDQSTDTFSVLLSHYELFRWWIIEKMLDSIFFLVRAKFTFIFRFDLFFSFSSRNPPHIFN